MATRSTLLGSLRHRDFAWFMGAFATSSIGSWASSVALAVWLIQETGSAGWVAASVTCRFVPSLLMSAYSGVLAERFERVRLMMSLDVALTLIQVAVVVEMVAGVHPAVVVVTAAVSATVATVYGPAAAAMTPQLVPERDLGAANAVRNTVDEVCVIVGPAIAGAVIALADPSLAVAINAVTFAASAALLSRVRARSVPVDVTAGGEIGLLQQMLVGVRTIGESSATATLVAFSVLATLVYGIDSVLFVVISDDVLGTGPEGAGYLLAGLGVGGILAAGLVTRLETLPRLGLVILGGMTLYCLPTLLFLFVDVPELGFVAQVLRGAATLVVDVLALTALQRTVPADRLARVFGAFDSLVLAAVLVGSLVVPIGLSWWGIDGVLWASGLGIPVLCLLASPWLFRMDRESLARRELLRPRTSLLGGLDLFDSVAEGALEQLADSAEFVDVAAGQAVITQGEPADALYIVVEGTFRPAATDAAGLEQAFPPMEAGAVFGEIGLIDAVPRTASVVATTAGRLLRVDGHAFVLALTQDRPSTALLDGAAVRLGRSDSSAKLTQAGLNGGD